MIGGARGMFRTSRQIIRATKQQKTKGTSRSTCSNSSSRNIYTTVTREESIIMNGGKRQYGFGRSTTDTMAKAISVGLTGIPNRGVIDALHVVLQDLTAEDDDGR